MGRRRITSIFTAGLVAAAGIALYSQIEDTTLIHAGMAPDTNAEVLVSEAENTRRARPTPGAMVSAVTPDGPAVVSDKQTPTPKTPLFGTAAPSPFNSTGTPLNLSNEVEQKTWVKVSGSVVNVRSGPSVSAPRIGSFSKGTRLLVIERNAGWTKIEDPETGKSGWMKHDFLASLPGNGAPAS